MVGKPTGTNRIIGVPREFMDKYRNLEGFRGAVGVENSPNRERSIVVFVHPEGCEAQTVLQEVKAFKDMPVSVVVKSPMASSNG
jgi:hypothetical protein